jgi:ABC-type phosphonate transport system ATPase subunit
MVKGQSDASGLLAFFWDRFDEEAASTEELEFLAMAAGEASDLAFSLSKHVEGIACLINVDRDKETKTHWGSLQDDDQTGLLFRIASEINMIGRMAEIGSECAFELRTRAEKLAARSATDSTRASPAKQSSRAVRE